MGALGKLLILSIPVTSALLFYHFLIKPEPRPIVNDEFWGDSSLKNKPENGQISKFSVNIAESVLTDLKTRLKRELESNRLFDPLENVGFNYGFNTKFLKTIGQHWLDKYDWRAREKLLNKYPHFKTKIAGLEIHFQHVKTKTRNGLPPRPLLIVHGWPGSFVEFQKIIPLLAEPKNSKYNYELVIPSLPGYGFSSAATRPGMSPPVIANIFKRLMKRLGHEKFFMMGGDWGGVVTQDMATVYPDNVIAAQSTMCHSLTVYSQMLYALSTLAPNFFMESSTEKETVLPLPEMFSFLMRESGYLHLHATKPDTVGIALAHSPLGLAGYILEKFSTWTNRSWVDRDDGGLLEKFTMDELLDNVMIYWVTGSITSSLRLYKEGFDPYRKFQLDRVPTEVPFSCQYLREDFAAVSQFALGSKFINLEKYEITPVGGHFGAFEVPQIVAENALKHFESH